MPNLVPLLNDKKLFATCDGSISCYNLSYQEAYHAKSVGAYSESLFKYVRASQIKERLNEKDVRLLDVGFGLGYNLAVTINETLDCRYSLNITSLEKDPQMVDIVLNLHILWPFMGYNILRKLIKDSYAGKYTLDVRICDATIFLQNCNAVYDVIYFDPFSATKNTEMWDVGTVSNLYRILDKDGVIVTYACSKRIRSIFNENGFLCREMANLPREFQKGTIFYKA